MKVTRQQAEKNRERVVEVAGRLFREKGSTASVSTADEGRRPDARRLLRQVQVERIGERALGTPSLIWSGWNRWPVRQRADPLKAIVAGDLSISHRDDPGNGWCLPPLAPMWQLILRPGVTEGLRTFIGTGTKCLRTFKAARRKRALAIYASISARWRWLGP